MKYPGTLIAVKDMEKSKQFYHDVLGMEKTANRIGEIIFSLWRKL